VWEKKKVAAVEAGFFSWGSVRKGDAALLRMRMISGDEVERGE